MFVDAIWIQSFYLFAYFNLSARSLQGYCTKLAFFQFVKSNVMVKGEKGAKRVDQSSVKFMDTGHSWTHQKIFNWV